MEIDGIGIDIDILFTIVVYIILVIVPLFLMLYEGSLVYWKSNDMMFGGSRFFNLMSYEVWFEGSLD